MGPINWLLRLRARAQPAPLLLPPPVVPTWFQIPTFQVPEFVTELEATYTAIIEWDYREFNATQVTEDAVSLTTYVAKETYAICEAELRVLAKKSYVFYKEEVAPVVVSLLDGDFQDHADFYSTAITLLVIILGAYIYYVKTLIPRDVRIRTALSACHEELKEAIKKTNFNPLLLRLAWSDAVTYDSSIGLRNWPYCGGVNGSIHFDNENFSNENAGLNKAILFLTPFKTKYKDLSW